MQTGRAPSWAIPLLCTYVVATAERDYLRGLDQTSFSKLARGCDQFLLGSTIPWLLVSSLLFADSLRLVAVTALSTWGVILIAIVGRPVALERKRRAGGGSRTS